MSIIQKFKNLYNFLNVHHAHISQKPLDGFSVTEYKILINLLKHSDPKNKIGLRTVTQVEVLTFWDNCLSTEFNFYTGLIS